VQTGAVETGAAEDPHWGWPSTYSVQTGAVETGAAEDPHWGWPSTYSVQTGAVETGAAEDPHCGCPSTYSVQTGAGTFEHWGWPSTYSLHCITVEETGAAGAEDVATAETDAGYVGAADDAGAASDEQSAEANGIGTVSVAPPSVMRVVVQPHAGIGPPE